MTLSRLQPTELNLADMGELGAIIPASEPRMQGEYIPVCAPRLAGNELAYATRAIETGWISSMGGYVKEFEARWAEACNTRYAVACANGTVALHLALAALGIGPGDEVILPAFTMIATINAVRYCGATPVLVDSEPEFWQLDVEQVAHKISKRTRAIIPVHTYGHPADMDALTELGSRYGIAIVEDAAEAHGAEYKGRRTGGLGTAASFSFYANKVLTTGEGGMVTTNDATLAKYAWNLRDHAFSTERHFWHKFVGFNYRMTNLQAAVGLAQVEQLQQLVYLRRSHAAAYTYNLRGVPGITTPPEAPWAQSVFWMYGILVDAQGYGMGRDALRQVLAHNGIETRTFFIPMHCQPVYWDKFKGQRYPVAERLCRDGLYLPSGSSLTVGEIERIAAVIRKAAK